MTIPYMGGQVASLLYKAKQQSGLSDEEDPLQGAPPSAMPFRTPLFNPNAQDPRSTSPQGDPTHAHRSGFGGGLLHMLGADRINEQTRELLDPQQEQTLLSMGPIQRFLRGGQGSIAQSMIRTREQANTIEDTAQARQMANANRVRREAIRMGMRPPPLDPKGQMEWYQELQARYTGAGLTEDAAAIGETLKVLEPKVVSQGQQLMGRSGVTLGSVAPAPIEVARGAAWLNPKTGKFEIPAPIAAEPRVVGGVMHGGKPATVAVDPSTGRVMWSLPEAQSAAGTGRTPTEAESKDYIYAAMLENALPVIEKVVDNIRPEIITALRTDPTGASRIAETDDEQRFVRAVLQFTAAVNRKESGMALTKQEVSNTMDRFVDTGFDRGPVRQDKKDARADYLRRMRLVSRRAREHYEGDGASTPDISLVDRMRELRAEGKTKEEAMAIAAREGYTP
jgi:hypothetical protein